MNQEEVERHALAVAQKALENNVSPGDVLDEYTEEHAFHFGDETAVLDVIADRVRVVLEP